MKIGINSINCLLYADDIVLLSETKQGLQNSLNVISSYCNVWKLHVNVSKSKVVVFNSNGRSHTNDFTLNSDVLQTVPRYCYLGVMLHFNGNFNLAVSILTEKARKALFKVKKSIGLDHPCKLLEKLFDSIISPILLYCNEVWGVDTSPSDSSMVEKFHMKFIKEILGVHCKTTNVACRSELGRLPIRSKIMFSSIKFLNHIISSENTLVFKLFQATEKDNPWTNKIYSIIKRLGFPFLVNSKHSLKPFLSRIKQRIQDQYIQEELYKISQSNKLNFFQSLNFMNKRSYYVDIVHKRSERSILSKIRLSAHSLNIEKGRHLSTPESERTCKICNTGDVEDELHFLSICTKYSPERSQYKKKVSDYLNFDINLLNDNFLINCLNSNSYTILKLTCNYINNCLNIRNDTLSLL